MYNERIMATTQPARARVDEASLMAQLTREGLSGERWSNGPHALYPPHDHPYGKVLVVVSGRITLTIEGARRRLVEMRPGDRMELPPRTLHSAVAGPEGVVCIEAHRPEAARR